MCPTVVIILLNDQISKNRKPTKKDKEIQYKIIATLVYRYKKPYKELKTTNTEQYKINEMTTPKFIK